MQWGRPDNCVYRAQAMVRVQDGLREGVLTSLTFQESGHAVIAQSGDKQIPQRGRHTLRAARSSQLVLREPSRRSIGIFVPKNARLREAFTHSLPWSTANDDLNYTKEL